MSFGVTDQVETLLEVFSIFSSNKVQLSVSPLPSPVIVTVAESYINVNGSGGYNVKYS